MGVIGFEMVLKLNKLQVIYFDLVLSSASDDRSEFNYSQVMCKMIENANKTEQKK